MKIEVSRILKTVRENLKNGKYIPLPDKDSKIIHKFYAEQVGLPLDGGEEYLHNEFETLISRGYERIVLGDYGPYIEMTKDQVVLENIEQRWPGKAKSGIKYIWMETLDKERTKVYLQCNTVPYANYRIGYFYVDPRLVFYVSPKEWEKMIKIY